MFFQGPPPAPVQQAPAVVAVFAAANTTLERALGYDLSLVEDDPPAAHRTATRRSHAHLHKKGNFYNGAVNPTPKSFPIGLNKTSSSK